MARRKQTKAQQKAQREAAAGCLTFIGRHWKAIGITILGLYIVGLIGKTVDNRTINSTPTRQAEVGARSTDTPLPEMINTLKPSSTWTPTLLVPTGSSGTAVAEVRTFAATSTPVIPTRMSPPFVSLTPVPSTAPSATSQPPTTMPATIAPAKTFYVIAAANVRSCARRDCQQIQQLTGGTAVDVIGSTQGESVSGSTAWYIVRINGQTAYVHTSLLSEQAPAAVSADIGGDSSSSDAGAPQFTCPRNCKTAVAMGLNEQQAGQCRNLDADEDHVACYGN